MLPDITEFSLFSAVAPEDAEALRGAARLYRFPAGTAIFSQGDPVRGFYLVRAGMVKIFRLSPNGQEQVLAVMGPSQTFAEAALFMKGYPANAECVEDCVLLFVEREALLGLLARDPELSLRISAGMALKLRQLVRLVDDLTLRDARGRICRYLLGLVEEESSRKGGWQDGGAIPQSKGGESLRLPVSQTLLARLLGFTSETLSRTLKALRDDGLIDLPGGRGRIRIVDLERMRAAVGEVEL